MKRRGEERGRGCSPHGLSQVGCHNEMRDTNNYEVLGDAVRACGGWEGMMATETIIIILRFPFLLLCFNYNVPFNLIFLIVNVKHRIYSGNYYYRSYTLANNSKL